MLLSDAGFSDSAWGHAVPTVSVDYSFARPQVQRAMGCSRLTVPGCQIQSSPGTPCLPFQTARIVLPAGTRLEKAEARVIDQPIWLNLDHPIEHGQAPWPTGSRRAFVPPASGLPEATIYSSQGPYPASRVQLLSIQRMQGQTIAVLRLFPIQYYPAQGRIDCRFTSAITLGHQRRCGKPGIE